MPLGGSDLTSGGAILSVHGGSAMPDHVEVSDLRKFLLLQQNLQDHQKAHIIRCNECLEAMAKVTVESLEREEKGKES